MIDIPISKANPRSKIIEVNIIQLLFEEDYKDFPKKSLALVYMQCQLEEYMILCIIDSGVGGYIISKVMFNQLGWEIKALTRLMIIVADRCRAVGKVSNLPIQFDKLVIPINAIIIYTISYDLIIRNNWLAKVRAIIDLQKISIYWKGQYYKIPINPERGIHPELIKSNNTNT